LNWANIVAVAVGGSVGSVARYLVGVMAGRLFGTSFPWGTLLINIIGSCALGALAEALALRWDASPVVRVFLTIGICGGFTTFSTFSLDAVYLMNRGDIVLAAAYVAASVTLSIGGLYTGLYAVRAILPYYLCTSDFDWLSTEGGSCRPSRSTRPGRCRTCGHGWGCA
jgi:fluoride exporter